MKKLICVLFALAPMTLFAYPIEVEKQLNGSEVSYTTDDVDRNMGSITLYNAGQEPVACTAAFVNGPEAPKRRKANLAPGQQSYLTVNFNRAIIKLRITLTCAANAD
ncbi:3-phosphoglycerate kinase [Pseudomonas sp. RIT-PI-AD]|uniref:3-phosphoglycerate kinase n=1 Tax=Pseudomonas sp. RIT-PI-AD TaxID=3035294 RepID=UPI0021D7FDF7|nr:3-phosphoglycerate kinase [Pseudomonas sp. RIT-PI-AD]